MKSIIICNCFILTKHTRNSFRNALLILVMSIMSCEGPKGSNRQVPIQNPVNSSVAIGRSNVDSVLAAFYKRLIDINQIDFDTSWHSEAGFYSNSEFAILRRPASSDVVNECVSFPFRDIDLQYCHGLSDDYFQLNGFRVKEGTGSTNNIFPLNTINKFSYYGKSYVCLTSRPQMMNGSLNFNYFFDVSERKAVYDVYENHWMPLEVPFLYGNIDDNQTLDRLRFDGAFDLLNDSSDIITIIPEEYTQHTWRSILDKQLDTFMIKLRVREGDNKIEIAYCHWPKRIMEP